MWIKLKNVRNNSLRLEFINECKNDLMNGAFNRCINK